MRTAGCSVPSLYDETPGVGAFGGGGLAHEADLHVGGCPPTGLGSELPRASGDPGHSDVVPPWTRRRRLPFDRSRCGGGRRLPSDGGQEHLGLGHRRIRGRRGSNNKYRLRLGCTRTEMAADMLTFGHEAYQTTHVRTFLGVEESLRKDAGDLKPPLQIILLSQWTLTPWVRCT